MPRLSSWLEAAVCHQTQGDLMRAEELYRKILNKRPDHSAALHMLGVLASETGRTEEATLLLAQSIELEPEVDTCLDLGRLLEQQCRLDAALACYRQAVDLDPQNRLPWERLAQFLDRMERYEDSSSAWAHRVRMEKEKPGRGADRPSEKDLLRFHWANSLALAGHPELARSQYRIVTSNAPAFVKGLFHLSVIETQLGNTGEAILILERLLAEDPSHAKGWNNLGILRQVFGGLDAAIPCYECALAQDPGNCQAVYNLAAAYQQTGRLEKALAMYERLCAMEIRIESALINYGNTLLAMNRAQEAISIFEQVMQVTGKEPAAGYNRGLARLVLGDLEGGFSGYEGRFDLPDFPKRQFAMPLWTDQDLAGRKILIWSEQGLGDTLQFIRFAAKFIGIGAEVIVECPRSLAGLLETAAGVSRVSIAGEPIATADYHIPILSLAHRFGTTLATIPSPGKYLAAANMTVGELEPGKLKVGLVWAGNPNHKNDRNRSMAASALAPLQGLRDVQFVSLQKDLPPAGVPPMTDVRHYMENFATTASLISQLDLVISVDTAMAHLAGALGKPVWLMLPHCPDWRWMLDRDDSPWYPTMRIFRQERANDWTSVVCSIAALLSSSGAGQLLIAGGQPISPYHPKNGS